MPRPDMKRYRSFLVKPASWDCNLGCDYCFYKRTEDTYPGEQHHRMTLETFTTLADQAQAQGTEAVSYVWQGGEPMLMGLDFYRDVLEIQRERRLPNQLVTNTIQTNGILIDDDWAAFFAENGILVGISVDGPEELHDIHRFDYAGNSAFDRVLAACDIMDKHEVEYNILTVVTSETTERAKDIYRFFRERDLHYLQFIDCIEEVDGEITPFSVDGVSYGKFLCELFDEWVEDGYPYVSIRLFDNLLQYLVGRPPECCMYKDECGAYFVVEYNGDVYPCDFFVEEDWKLGNITTDSIDDLIDSDKHREFYELRSVPHDDCEECRWLGFCQRGCIKFRGFPDGDFTKKQHLCTAYKMLFDHAEETYRFLTWDIIRRHKGLPPPEIGRNDPCICGSGKKFKKCCGKFEAVMKR
jgi:uncharacterized protein